MSKEDGEHESSRGTHYSYTYRTGFSSPQRIIGEEMLHCLVQSPTGALFCGLGRSLRIRRVVVCFPGRGSERSYRATWYAYSSAVGSCSYTSAPPRWLEAIGAHATADVAVRQSSCPMTHYGENQLKCHRRVTRLPSILAPCYPLVFLTFRL